MTSAIHDIEVRTIDGRLTSLAEFKPKTLLIVNVASRCGLTPQHAGLQELYDRYRDRGFEVLGFPCNQFLFQEPGDETAISDFCSVNYGVTFPLFSKIKVNGSKRHPLFAALSAHPDLDGKAGRVRWNFEKFLISPDGEVVGRFRSRTTPDDPAISRAIEEQIEGVAA